MRSADNQQTTKMPDKTFHIMTFGCQMNVNDSDWLRRSLLALGFNEAPFEQARVHILNTCSVREKPENKVYTELGRIRLLAREFPERDVIACVGGCVAQQIGEKLFARSRELKLVFGTDGIAHTPEAIALLAENSERKISLLDFTGEYTEREHHIGGQKTTPTQGGNNLEPCPPAAYVNIMQGCDNFCAYCIVPFVRGRQKSRGSAAILEECRLLLDNGAREITLLGQNVNSYGLDGRAASDGEPGFVELLYRVAALPGLRRLRFITPHPKDMPEELIRAFAELPALSPRLHLPLQAGSDRILKNMGRKYDLARYMELVDGLRAARPDIQLSTDIIVGFPGETDEDFERTMEAAARADFASSFSFVYSDRPGTRASKLKNKVERKEALKRLARLQKWQNDNTARILSSMIGSRATVMIEGSSLKEKMPGREDSPAISLHGRDDYGFSVNIMVAEEKAPALGDLVKVRIVGAGKHTLKGEITD